ncbi:hypothetical protein E5357_03520 [Hominisplanchenecus murintestinalis]|uniref:Uncharacterized protein n=1 Tax=Hominisplanchenecus murintestinalis TaxID=2941517 RepID=A0AC61R3A7_9FIRM|nr:hypothetical protein [Hominisplanchenecus murintestinalis]NBH99091.1 hypothetical protein [Lachnospiraceae bacterium]NBI76322.1 hypothetical protein [Lachnospiraceae bacterium]RKJ81986.1 hypothetical protein D7Y41_24785 [Anaerotruncus sp. 1XD22-93]TGY00099.1 hypothetical protein E5357_03520 [Hominisplanchenecus murintestinalis]
MKIQKFKTIRILITALMFLTGTLVITSGAQAADSRYYVSMEAPAQTQYGTDNAVISWKLSYISSSNTTETAGYNIYLGEDYGSTKLFAKTPNTFYKITGLEDGKKYYVKVEPYAADGSIGSGRSLTIETMPARVKNFRQERWWYFINMLEVAWDRIETADTVNISLYNSKGKKVQSKILSPSSSSVSFSKMKDEVYTVKIQASRTINGNTWQTPVSTIQCFNQARISSAKVSKKKLTVKWKKVGGATGYDIYVSTKQKSGYKKLKSVGKNTTKATFSKFKGKSFNPKKTYYIYIETKKKNGKRIDKSGRLYYWNTKNTATGYF